LRLLFLSPHAIGEARYVSPRIRTAQAMRAVLLAIATVVTRAGLRSRSDRTQVPVFVVLLSALRMTEVALDLHRFCSGQVLMLSGPLFEGHG
jgi:hypothetical protein